MKVISFNANGIRAAARKGFYAWLHDQNADFVCIQETKAALDSLSHDDQFFPTGYDCHYVAAEKKGYSGVALYARQAPLSVVRCVDYPVADSEGRYLQFDYPGWSIASIYFPSGTSGEHRQVVKDDFLAWVSQRVHQLRADGRELILCGDFNIAHHPTDLKNWRANQKHSGFLPHEREWLNQLFGPMGFVDAFRVLNQEPSQYTWWSNRGQARANNVGWRIDYQAVTPAIASSITEVDIYVGAWFSDHAPLVIVYDGAWCV